MILIRRAGHLLVLLLLIKVCNAQRSSGLQGVDRDITVLNPVPPSPQFASLGKFGDVPVNWSTGVPLVEIKLYEVKIDGVSVPISIRNHPSGIKVSDVSNVVGLGWSLDAGGGIFRSIRGTADEKATYGYLLNSVNQPYINNVNANICANNTQTMFSQGYYNQTMDITQDDYSYSFNGFSGKFFWDDNRALVPSLKTNNKFSYQINYNAGLQRNELDFNCKDDLGNEYIFNQPEISTIRNTNGFSRFQVNSSGTTGWRVSQIKSQKNRVINFEYEPYYLNYFVPSVDIVTSPTDPQVNQYWLDFCYGEDRSECYYITCGCKTTSSIQYGTSNLIFDNLLVSKISSDDEEVSFYYSDLTNASEWKRKLDSIVVRPKYSTSVTARFYFSYSVFPGDPRLRLDKVSRVNTSTVPGSGYDMVHQFEYFPGELPAINSRSMDIFGYYNGASNSSLVSSNAANFYFPTADRTINEFYMKRGTLKKIIYPTGGSTTFDFEANIATNNYLMPGLRVKTITNENLISNNTQVQNFSYTATGGYDNSTIYDMQPDLAVIGACEQLSFSSAGNEFMPLPISVFYDLVEMTEENGNEKHKLQKKFTGFDVMIGDMDVRQTEETVFDYVSNAFTPRSKNSWNYGFAVTSNGPKLHVIKPSYYYQAMTGCTPNIYCGNYYQGIASIYERFQSKIQLQSHETISYEGNSELTQVVEYSYNNASLYVNPIQQQTINSKGKTIIQKTFYPDAVGAISAPAYPSSTVITDMIQKNIVVPIQEEAYVDQTLIKRKRVQYSNVNNSILPSIESYQFESGSLEDRVTYTYDNRANLITATKDGFNTSYLWDDKDRIIAEVKNAQISDIAYSSFESPEKGGWLYSGPSSAYGITGTKSYNLSFGDINKSLDLNRVYTLRYWTTSTSALAISGSDPSGGKLIQTALRNGLNWKCFEHRILNTSLLVITGTAVIDEIKISPEKSILATLGYATTNQINVTSNNSEEITYFTYDGLNRLQTIKDRNGNIIKQNCYSYTGQPEDCIKTYGNEEFNIDIPKDDCPLGSEGSYVTYTVPANKYKSLISIDDANSKALAEIIANGQAYANLNGLCETLPLCNINNCSAPEYHCVNGECLLGIKVYTSSSYDPNTGKYTCVYHYEWSDGFWSDIFLEFSYFECPL